MELLLASILFLIGVLLIVKGGDLFVDAATWMAEASGIPKFVVGATIVSLATTLPELLVSSMAAFELKTDMAIGNAIGSVTANTGLILGVSLVFLPVAIRRSQIAVKSAILVLGALFLWLLSRTDGLSLLESAVLLLLFAAFIAENVYSAAKSGQPQEERIAVTRRTLVKNIALFVVGAAALVVGSDLLVDNGTILAVALGVPERIIAVTMIAIGTSLPELVTAVTAVAKKQSSLSVGNIFGANIIDITIILPLCALISHGTLPVAAESVRIDMPVCLLETLIAVVPTLILKRFTRVQGLVMLAIYLAYLGLTVFG